MKMATAMGTWCSAASSWLRAHSCITSRAEFFGKTSNHPSDSASLQPSFGTLWLLAFPKTKITFEREEISDCQWDSGKYNGRVHGDSNKGFCRVFWTMEETLGELCEIPRCLLWRGLMCHCPMYNSSCIFFNKCLCFPYYMAGYLLDRPHIVIISSISSPTGTDERQWANKQKDEV